MVLALSACSNKSDVKFMGESLKTPCESFNEHLEDNGFKKNDEFYEGEYLGKDVKISTFGNIKGHYKDMMLQAVFSDSGMDAKQYYKSLCNKIRSEHSGFKEENEDKLGLMQTSFYGENGSMISVSYAQESNYSISLGLVVAIYRPELESDN